MKAQSVIYAMPLLLLSAVAFAGVLLGDGSIRERTAFPVVEYRYSFVSNATGEARVQTSESITGILRMAAFDVTDATTPDAGAQITVLNDDGLDLLAGAWSPTGSITSVTRVTPDHPLVSSRLIIDVTAAGAAKSGVITLWIQR